MGNEQTPEEQTWPQSGGDWQSGSESVGGESPLQLHDMVNLVKWSHIY